MSKKHNTKPCQPYQPRPVKVADKAGDELAAFPTDRHILTPKQREVPNPAAALDGLGQPSERQRLRAATICQEQHESRTQRLAPTVREDLQAVRRRPWDAPMATRIGAMPDPLATLAWDAVVADAAKTAEKWWGRWQFSLALAAWSTACFVLGRLAA